MFPGLAASNSTKFRYSHSHSLGAEENRLANNYLPEQDTVRQKIIPVTGHHPLINKSQWAKKHTALARTHTYNYKATGRDSAFGISVLTCGMKLARMTEMFHKCHSAVTQCFIKCYYYCSRSNISSHKHPPPPQPLTNVVPREDRYLEQSAQNETCSYFYSERVLDVK